MRKNSARYWRGVVAIPLLLAGCAGVSASQASKEQHCPSNSTPVVDENWNPRGCNAAKDDKVTKGSACAAFGASARTVDIDGNLYECRNP
jgi:hypothetical protein